jgi:hypothetical protein
LSWATYSSAVPAYRIGTDGSLSHCQ